MNGTSAQMLAGRQERRQRRYHEQLTGEEHDSISFFSEPSVASEDNLSSSLNSMMSSPPAVGMKLNNGGSPRRNRLTQYMSHPTRPASATRVTTAMNGHAATALTSSQQQAQHLHYAEPITPGVFIPLPAFYPISIGLVEEDEGRKQQQQSRETPITGNHKHNLRCKSSSSSSTSSNSDICYDRRSSTTHGSSSRSRRTNQSVTSKSTDDDAEGALSNHHEHDKLLMDDFIDDYDQGYKSDASSSDYDDAKSTTSSSTSSIHNNNISDRSIQTDNSVKGKRRPQMNLRSMYAPAAYISNDEAGHTWFTCPKCGTRQREFFGVYTARSSMDSPVGYLALYFLLYVVASLFIFGKEEGWRAVDCLYFSVITLTTTGFGDLTPSSNEAKIICSIFIYFGVACIGLLLGSSLAMILDAEAHTEAKTQLEKSCKYCQNIRLKEQSLRTSNNSNLFYEQGADQRRTFLGAMFGRRAYMTERSPTYRNDCNMNNKAGLPTGNDAHHQPLLSPPSYNTGPSAYGSLTISGSDANTKDEAITPLLPLDANTDPTVKGTSESFFIDVEQEPIPKKKSERSPRDFLASTHHTRHFSIDFSSGPQEHTNRFMSYLPYSRSGVTTSAESSSLLNKSITSSFYHGNAPLSYPNGPAVDNGISSTSKIQEQQNPYFDLPHQKTSRSENNSRTGFFEITDDNSSFGLSDSSVDSWENPLKPLDGFLAARHVFLTLKQAVMNSLLIIAIGSMGFHLIEGLDGVDAFYFTTVLLTTVGYGDITPKTDAGKIFATIYVLVAGTVLLHNMSLISMIPLEFRKRRIERAVLLQFGERLDDEALRELAVGPLTQRLQLAANRSDGLAECTREMFSLAMLVRLGRVSERDVKATFAAFRRLDRDNDGKLNSKDIICGEFIRRRRAKTRQEKATCLNGLNNLGAQPSYGYDFSNMGQYINSTAATTNAPGFPVAAVERADFGETPFTYDAQVHPDTDDDYFSGYPENYEEPETYVSDHSINYGYSPSNAFPPPILPRYAHSFGEYEEWAVSEPPLNTVYGKR